MSGWLPGVILIVIGATLFAIQWLHLDADIIVLVIGLVFVAAYAATRRYGLLIAAGSLTGLGAGIILQDFAVTREAVVLGLGMGFLAIYGVDLEARRSPKRARWWPLIPGAIFTIIAGAGGAFGDEGGRTIQQAWPIILVVIGAWLLLRDRVSV